MLKRPLNTSVIAAVLVLFLAMLPACRPATMQSAPKLLSDPFLQLPTENSVRVVWFTEFPGTRHSVTYGKGLNRSTAATTSKLSRVREDQNSKVGAQTEDGQIYKEPIMRDVWRHEAVVTGLTPGRRVPYRVTSEQEDGSTVSSAVFSLAPEPPPGMPLKILLTSDHQSMPMTPANLQKVAETMGRVDAVFMAGDLVNIPDRASEWFDDNRGRAFFASLQGRTQAELEKNGVKTVYQGGALIQHAPLFTAIGNHEVMGRFSRSTSLKDQFGDPIPRAAALSLANQTQLNTGDPTVRETWLKNHSFNTDTYEEIFTLPTSETGGEKYYAVTFGDVRLVSLYATQIWRTPKLGPEARGKYREREADLNNPANWGYGQHIFEPIKAGSAQYTWLKKELASPAFQKAKYKIVMLHHPIHSLGDNIVPAFTDPQQVIERDEDGTIKAVRYEYPLEADYLFRDIQPLLEATGVQLVLYGHSHLWHRFTSSQGVHFLETSNVGNTYGANLEKQRKVPTGYDEKYVATGDPNGLEAVVPTIAPLLDENSKPLSFIASDDITVFSILDTGAGTVSSSRFDTRKPESPVVKFDEFKL